MTIDMLDWQAYVINSTDGNYQSLYTLRGGSHMLMKCDECGHVQNAKIHQKRSYGIYHAYVECDMCFVRTTSFVTDETTRNRIEELNRLRSNGENPAKQKKLNKKIDKRMAMLKDKYGYQ